MSETADIPWNEMGTLEALTFDMRDETFAVEAMLVREILDPLPETRVPGSAPLVGSVINFRGRIIPLADLRPAFGMAATPPTPDSRIIVLECERNGEPCQIGIKADKVHEVVALVRTGTEMPPRIGLKWRADYIRGLSKRNGDIVIVPDLQAIFATQISATDRYQPELERQ
jgi:purine-binding chemotaxis protein CheW